MMMKGVVQLKLINYSDNKCLDKKVSWQCAMQTALLNIDNYSLDSFIALSLSRFTSYDTRVMIHKPWSTNHNSQIIIHTNYFLGVWYSSMHKWQLHDPSGGSDSGGFRQYMWYPRSQSSQNNNWSSLSEVPHNPHDLHSMHCHLYFFTEMIILGVNCKQVGWADRPQSAQETKSSADLVFLFSTESPRQKSQYWLGEAGWLAEPLLAPDWKWWTRWRW